MRTYVRQHMPEGVAWLTYVSSLVLGAMSSAIGSRDYALSVK
jgi:hypothetical protein